MGLPRPYRVSLYSHQAIGDPSQRTDDGDLIRGGRPQTTLNVAEAHHVDASHGTFIQGDQTNVTVFSKTTTTFVDTRASPLSQVLKLVHHHIHGPMICRKQT